MKWFSVDSSPLTLIKHFIYLVNVSVGSWILVPNTFQIFDHVNVVEVKEYLPRSLTASSNFFSSMAFCTSWVWWQSIKELLHHSCQSQPCVHFCCGSVWVRLWHASCPIFLEGKSLVGFCQTEAQWSQLQLCCSHNSTFFVPDFWRESAQTDLSPADVCSNVHF